MSRVHPQARTTPRTRAEIRSCEAPLTVLAERYNVTKATVCKWRGRQDMQDRSHRPNTLSTTLTSAQEAIVVELRRTLLLPLDDLLALTHEFINRAASRSGLDRCLRRHGVSRLQSLIPAVEGQDAPKKAFKDYEPGFLHMDIKYLPQMPPTRPKGATSSLPSTGPRAGSTFAPTATRRMPAAPTSSGGCTGPHRCGFTSS